MAYNPKKISVIADGRHLTGFSEDTKVSAEKEEEAIFEYVGVDGEVDHAINANNAGVVTITLRSTSPSISYLNELANARKLFPLSVVDLNDNGVNASATEAFVERAVFPERGKEISDVEFNLRSGDLTIE